MLIILQRIACWITSEAKAVQMGKEQEMSIPGCGQVTKSF
jgi:hypothetical protein